MKSDNAETKSSKQDNVSGATHSAVSILDNVDNRVNGDRSPSLRVMIATTLVETGPVAVSSKPHSPSQPATPIPSTHVPPFLSPSALEAFEYQRDTAGWIQASHEKVIVVSIIEVETKKKNEKRTSRQAPDSIISAAEEGHRRIESAFNYSRSKQRQAEQRVTALQKEEQDALQTLELPRLGSSKAQKDCYDLDMKPPTPPPPSAFASTISIADTTMS